jgi:hypothetical protein
MYMASNTDHAGTRTYRSIIAGVPANSLLTGSV